MKKLSKFEETIVISDDEENQQDVVPEATDSLATLNYQYFFDNDQISDVISDDITRKVESQDDSTSYIMSYCDLVRDIIGDEHYRELLNESEKLEVQSFLTLSADCQFLFIRFLCRKYKWISIASLKYNFSPDQLLKILDSLVTLNFLERLTEETPASDLLPLLRMTHLKQLAQHFHVAVSTKSVMVERLSKLVRRPSVMSLLARDVVEISGPPALEKVLRRRSLDLLGPCFRVKYDARTLFADRIPLVHSLVVGESSNNMDVATPLSALLFDFGRWRCGQLIFPQVKPSRQFKLIASRDDLIDYQEALRLDMEASVAMEQKNKSAEALQLCDFARSQLENEEKMLFWEQQLASRPCFLRCFCAGFVLLRCAARGVTLLERQHKWKEAVLLLRWLLAKNPLLTICRGTWWQRLTLNLEQHLHEHAQALTACFEGLKDPSVSPSKRYGLVVRARRIVAGNTQLASRGSQIPTVNVKSPYHVRISACLPRKASSSHAYFVSKTQPDHLLSVEQVALEHYQSQEMFSKGVHAEGITLNTLFMLCCSAEIFADGVPDAFHFSNKQSAPLDLCSSHFWSARALLFRKRMELLRQIEKQRLEEIVLIAWQRMKHLKLPNGISFDLLAGREWADLAACIGGRVLAAVCERLAEGWHNWRAGQPDLTLWNFNDGRAKLVEVKGPGDQLSDKQLLWLHFLNDIGLEVEVCHVEAVDSKRLRKN